MQISICFTHREIKKKFKYFRVKIFLYFYFYTARIYIYEENKTKINKRCKSKFKNNIFKQKKVKKKCTKQTLFCLFQCIGQHTYKRIFIIIIQ